MRPVVITNKKTLKNIISVCYDLFLRQQRSIKKKSKNKLKNIDNFRGGRKYVS